MNTFSYLLSILGAIGVYGFIAAILFRFFYPSFLTRSEQDEEKKSAAAVFIWASAWPLGVCFRGLLSSWAYYVDVSVFWSALFIFAISLLGLFFISDFKRAYDQTNFKIFFCIGWKKPIHLFSLLILALSFTPYCNFILLPWFDHDESAVYGYVAKLISHGWVYSDQIFTGSIHDRPVLAQALDGQFYGLISDTIMIRLMRLVGLMAAVVQMISFMRLFFKFTPLMIWTVICFLMTPELRQYLGTSLKVDSIVMILEITGFLWLGLGILHFKESKLKLAASFAAVAFLCFLGGYSGNLSGVYALIMTTAFLLLCFWKGRQTFGANRIALYMYFVFVLGIIGSPTYIVHVKKYRNPIYPFKASYPFEKGRYVEKLQVWKDRYNIQSLPNGILQPYMLVHLGLGLENQDWPIHASEKTISMNWLSPLLILMFLVPCFFRRNRMVMILGLLFFAQLVFWSLGLHYSRALLGTNALAVLVVGLVTLIPREELSRWQWYLQRFFVVGLVSVGGYLLYIMGLYQTTRQFASIPVKIFSSFYRDYYKVQMIAGYSENYLPTKDEISEIESMLSKFDHPVVFMLAPSGRVMHIMFENGIFRDSNPTKYVAPDLRKGQFLMVNRKFVNVNAPFSMEEYLYAQNLCFKSRDKNWFIFGNSCS